jgi:hypothetical protein
MEVVEENRNYQRVEQINLFNKDKVGENAIKAADQSPTITDYSDIAKLHFYFGEKAMEMYHQEKERRKDPTVKLANYMVAAKYCEMVLESSKEGVEENDAQKVCERRAQMSTDSTDLDEDDLYGTP